MSIVKYLFKGPNEETLLKFLNPSLKEYFNQVFHSINNLDLQNRIYVKIKKLNVKNEEKYVLKIRNVNKKMVVNQVIQIKCCLSCIDK